MNVWMILSLFASAIIPGSIVAMMGIVIGILMAGMVVAVMRLVFAAMRVGVYNKG